jgi:hypothetical protein
MSSTTEIKALVDTFLAEDAKFEGGNKAAGTRARAALGDIAKLCKTRRQEIQASKNAAKAAA